jgi:hypothetical protein
VRHDRSPASIREVHEVLGDDNFASSKPSPRQCGQLQALTSPPDKPCLVSSEALPRLYARLELSGGKGWVVSLTWRV